MNGIQKSTHYRWVIIALLFSVTVINYIDRASISYAIDIIAKEFQFSDDQIGLILGAFGFGYVFTTVLGGVAADLVGAKKTMAVAIFFWGLTAFMTGHASSFVMILMARIILGVAEGPNFPAMTRAISDWLPEKERNIALSCALVSVPLALAIGGPLATQLILAFTWQGTYFILAGAAFCWLPIWWLFFKDKPSESAWVSKEELSLIEHPPSIQPQHQYNFQKYPWRVLLLNKTLLANNWAFFVFGYYLFFFMTWLPSYLRIHYQLDLTKVGLYSSIPWLTAALFMVATGYVSDAIYRKTKSLRLSRSYPILLTQLFSTVCVIPIVYASNVLWAMFFIALAVGFAMGANAAYYAVNIDVAKKRAGSSLGIMDALFAISAFVSPVLTGFIVSLTGHFEAAFFVLAALGLSSVLFVFFFHNRK